MILMAVLFIMIFSFSGCTGSDETVDEIETGSGTEGIVSEFMPGAPPEEFSEDDTFEVNVKLENKGEHEVPPDEIAVYLLGVNPASVNMATVKQYLSECTDCNEEGLISAHYINNEWIPGGYDYLTWTDVTGAGLEYLVKISSDQNLNFVAQTCYLYNTKASADACFSDNAYAQTTGAETCDVSGEKNLVNSGAPIHITKAVENPAGKGKYTFTFFVENVGEGRSFSPEGEDILDNCTALKQSQLDRVMVESVTVGGSADILNGTCAGKKVLLVDGVGQFTCRVKPDTVVGDYTDIIEVVLRYGYYDQATKQVTVWNLIDNEEE
jgi:hypothetical protein